MQGRGTRGCWLGCWLGPACPARRLTTRPFCPCLHTPPAPTLSLPSPSSPAGGVPAHGGGGARQGGVHQLHRRHPQCVRWAGQDGRAVGALHALHRRCCGQGAACAGVGGRFDCASTPAQLPLPSDRMGEQQTMLGVLGRVSSARRRGHAGGLRLLQGRAADAVALAGGGLGQGQHPGGCRVDGWAGGWRSWVGKASRRRLPPRLPSPLAPRLHPHQPTPLPLPYRRSTRWSRVPSTPASSTRCWPTPPRCAGRVADRGRAGSQLCVWVPWLAAALRGRPGGRLLGQGLGPACCPAQAPVPCPAHLHHLHHPALPLGGVHPGPHPAG